MAAVGIWGVNPVKGASVSVLYKTQNFYWMGIWLKQPLPGMPTPTLGSPWDQAPGLLLIQLRAHVYPLPESLLPTREI